MTDPAQRHPTAEEAADDAARHAAKAAASASPPTLEERVAVLEATVRMESVASRMLILGLVQAMGDGAVPKLRASAAKLALDAEGSPDIPASPLLRDTVGMAVDVLEQIANALEREDLRVFTTDVAQ